MAPPVLSGRVARKYLSLCRLARPVADTASRVSSLESQRRKGLASSPVAATPQAPDAR